MSDCTRQRPPRFPAECTIPGCAFTASSYGQWISHPHNDGTGLFECNVCGKELSSKHSLQGHLRLHTQERPYACKECGAGFAWFISLCRHEAKHRRTFVCSACGATFVSESAYHKHRRRANKGMPCIEPPKGPTGTGKGWVCQRCGRAFTCEGRLERHLNAHAAHHGFACALCAYVCADRRTLANHAERVHGTGACEAKGPGDAQDTRCMTPPLTAYDPLLAHL